MKLTKSGSSVSSFDPNDDNIKDLAFDGSYLWAINSTGVIKKFTTSGALIDSIVGLLSGGWGLTYESDYLWASDPTTDMIYKISPQTGIEEIPNPKSQILKLLAYPNPFRKKTVISCQFPVASDLQHATVDLQLEIYDLSGKLVKRLLSGPVSNFQFPISVLWDGSDETGKIIPNGVYLYRLSGGDYTITKKLVLLH